MTNWDGLFEKWVQAQSKVIESTIVKGLNPFDKWLYANLKRTDKLLFLNKFIGWRFNKICKVIHSSEKISVTVYGIEQLVIKK